MPRKLAAGNWKMNGVQASLGEIRTLAEAHAGSDVDILICPPATLVSLAAELEGNIQVGGQDCHANKNGAHTGDTSAAMLKDSGAGYVIVGHSERRTDHKETNQQVHDKALAAWSENLIAVVCIGETLEERENGETNQVLANQLAGSVPIGALAANTVVAYEPVWAIGTGKIPTFEEISQAHAFIRGFLASQHETSEAHGMSLLYGGSVKPSNAAEIFALNNVDGALVGGASLKAVDFSAIISALEASA
ncbi:MAG: triose-phosphate isomerase [Paracoccaceae bacterium]|nr:triose-phosphate isomerase [Paracoccaceae bacterium]MDG2260113.1 triose-phosphate isomerase [Paracoccaceae bacterium]